MKIFSPTHKKEQKTLLRLKFGAKNRNESITHVWQKWRCSTPLGIYCNIQHSFSASAFVVKIATFAKRFNVSRKPKPTP